MKGDSGRRVREASYARRSGSAVSQPFNNKARGTSKVLVPPEVVLPKGAEFECVLFLR